MREYFKSTSLMAFPPNISRELSQAVSWNREAPSRAPPQELPIIPLVGGQVQHVEDPPHCVGLSRAGGALDDCEGPRAAGVDGGGSGPLDGLPLRVVE